MSRRKRVEFREAARAYLARRSSIEASEGVVEHEHLEKETARKSAPSSRRETRVEEKHETNGYEDDS